MDDWQLLDAYARDGSEAAFSRLVDRHLGLVHAAARRQVRDDALAADVAQAVFLLLARKAGSLGRRGLLLGWLFQTTRFVAARALRADARRQRREQEAASMQELHTPDPRWDQLAPEVDEALSRLGAADRNALLLRFGEGRNHREVANALGLTEEAARKRVNRAIEKLRGVLLRQGVTVTAGMLGSLLADRLCAAPPPGLATAISQGVAGDVIPHEAAGLAQQVASAWRRARLQLAVGVLGTAAVMALVVLAPRNFGPKPTVSAATALSSPPESGSSVHPNTGFQRSAGSGTFRLRVVAADTGEPLSDARVPVNFVSDGEWIAPADLRTDVAGECVIPLPRGVLMRLDAGAHLPGYENRFFTWNARWQHPRPEEYTLRLGRADTVGGIVVDGRGRPVPSVTVWLAYHLSDTSWREPDEDRERLGFMRRLRVGVTDAKGRWTCATIPPARDRFAFEFEHPDYAREDSLAVNRDDATAVGQEVLALVAAGRMVTTMQPGMIVYGQVVNASGEPVPDARIATSWHEAAVTTDIHGEFSLGPLRQGSIRLVATADGYAPRRFDAGREGPVRVSLHPGGVLRVRMVTPNGDPIAGATLALQDGFGEGALGWDGRSDDEGRIEWRSAPPGGRFTFTAYAPGHQYARNVPLTVDGPEHTMVLHPVLVVAGAVVDATTGEPVARFKAIPGNGREFPNFDRSQLFYGTDGAYRLDFDEAGEPVVRIEAEGYETTLGHPVPGPDGRPRCDFELRREDPNHAVRGVVLNADGTPAAGAEVALCTLETSVTLGPGRFLRREGGIHTVTDDAGRFAFPVVRAPHTVVAVSVLGFGLAGIPGNGPATIRLEPFGSIEGVVSRDRQPQPGLDVVLSEPSFLFQAGCVSPDVATFQQRTDAAGRFLMTWVPGGDYLLYLNPGLGISFTDETPVTVTSGRSATVTVGEPDPLGRLVTGRVTPSEPVSVGDWRRHVGTRVLSKKIPIIEPPAGLTAEARQRWRYGWIRTEEGRAHLRLRASYTVELDPDGSFSVRGVPPGDYELWVWARPADAARQIPWDARAASWQGTVSCAVTVPEPDPADPDAPLDLGPLEMKIRLAR